MFRPQMIILTAISINFLLLATSTAQECSGGEQRYTEASCIPASLNCPGGTDVCGLVTCTGPNCPVVQRYVCFPSGQLCFYSICGNEFCGLLPPSVTSRLGSDENQVRPFSAVRSVAVFKGSGALASTVSTRTVAVRSDGSRVELLAFEDPSGAGKGADLYRKKIIDARGKRWVVVEPLGESVTTYPLPTHAVDFLTSKVPSVCNENPVPAGQMLGFRAVYAESMNDVLAGNEKTHVTIRSWLAPDLNCFALRRELLIVAGGKQVGKTVESIIGLTEGEPAEWFFEVPISYIERSPSQAIAEKEKKLHREAPGSQSCATTILSLDKIYFEHWRRR